MPPLATAAEREPSPADEVFEIEWVDTGDVFVMPPLATAAQREPPAADKVFEIGSVDAGDAGDAVAMPPLAADAQREPPLTDEAVEFELADALDAMAGEGASGTVADEVEQQAVPPREEADQAGDRAGDLDDLFRQMRDESGRGQAEAAAMRAYDEAAVHRNEGRLDQAVACLRRAGRDPSLRFRAAVMLARIAIDRGQLDEAIAWFERGLESPAPSVQAERWLLYELGAALERAGEPMRAQAVFLELSAMEPGYRDVAARLDALAERRPNWLPGS